MGFGSGTEFSVQCHIEPPVVAQLEQGNRILFSNLFTALQTYLVLQTTKDLLLNLVSLSVSNPSGIVIR